MQSRSDKNVGEVIVGRIDQLHDDPQGHRDEQHNGPTQE